MLVAQGIPPEQAKQIAMEMIKAVAEGGMQEVTSDEKIHARFGGHITRQHYLFGGIGKAIGSVLGGIGSAAKGVVNAVKSVASSGLGKAALAAAAIYFGGPMLASATEGTSAGSFLFGTPVVGMDAIETGSLGVFGQAGQFAPLSGSLLGPIANSGIGKALSGMVPGKDTLTGAALGLGAGMLLGRQQQPTQNPGESNAAYQARVDAWKKTLNEGLSNPTLSAVNNPSSLFPNNPFYAQRRAEGGRIGYAGGGIGDIIGQATKQAFFGNNMLAAGGVPTGQMRQNPRGIHEIDYRKKGGFVPPIGIKEKADDIPAMLSNNEFVFTANAVRNAGNGDVNKGAKRMYRLMKHLEAGGIA
jgi:hypothetical protein